MARRRKGLVAILFPDLHRAYRKAKHDMRPDRALGRVLSVPEVMAGLRSLRRPTTRTSAASRKKQVATGKIVPAKKTTAKKTAAKKSATKRAAPYAAAMALPGQNRQAAAKVAKAAQPAAKKTVAVRKRNGQFDGRKSMRPDDLAAYERAQGGYVDPGMRIRNSQTRRG